MFKCAQQGQACGWRISVRNSLPNNLPGKPRGTTHQWCTSMCMRRRHRRKQHAKAARLHFMQPPLHDSLLLPAAVGVIGGNAGRNGRLEGVEQGMCLSVMCQSYQMSVMPGLCQSHVIYASVITGTALSEHKAALERHNNSLEHQMRNP